MKTIKIRFIHERDKYYIQRRGWFGWKDITYTIDIRPIPRNHFLMKFLKNIIRRIKDLYKL